MAQETQIQQQQQQQSGGPTPDEITQGDDDIEEFEIPKNKSMLDKIQVVFEKFATTSMGQMVFERCDRVLRALENTARWSMPQEDEPHTKLERPLPWSFFIPLIVWLRVLRFWLSIGSIATGGSKITPEAMVYGIQIKRRRLRAIRVSGLRQTRRVEYSSMSSSGSGRKSLIGNLINLFGSAVCRPGQHRVAPEKRVFGPASKATPSGDNALFGSSVKRPRDDDSVDLNLTADQLLNKYANDNSEDDTDYVPNLDEENDSTSSSSESLSSTEEADLLDEEKTASAEHSSKNDQTSLDQSVVMVKENGGPNHRPLPRPIKDIKLEPISDVDSGNELVKTPKDTKPNKTNDGAKQGPQKTSTEVAAPQPKPKETLNTTPNLKQQNLSVSKGAETKKSTPGHESAASLNPSISVKTAVAPNSPRPKRTSSVSPPLTREKCYRTITTQTAIEEYDWSITVKTEITHTKKYQDKQPKLDCSIELTPASSTEDIFYSPIGSPTDFHAIFHPVPLVKVTPMDAHSTPKESSENNGSTASETAESNPNQQKAENKSNPTPQSQYFYNKNRNKNRRY